MKWSLERICTVDAVEIDGIKIWEVSFIENAIANLTIGLCLLHNDLISSLSISDARDKFALHLSASKQNAHHPAKAKWDKNSASVVLSNIELEAILFFCLRAVRDGMAQADHIDVEARKSTGEHEGTFVLMFPNPKPPISGEEMRRRLGLS